MFLWLRKLFARLMGRVYYVNGYITLPPPLTPEQEEHYIQRMSAGDDSAGQKLIEHNLRLAVYIARRFDNTGLMTEDLVSIGSIGLIKAIRTFKAEKNIKLATYASRCIENEILMYLRKISNTRSEVSIDEPLNVDWDGNELLLSDVLGTDADSVCKDIENDEECKMLRTALKTLDERERDIMQMRYGFDGGKEMTQKEVADALGISQSYISRLEKKIIKRLKREMERIS